MTGTTEVPTARSQPVEQSRARYPDEDGYVERDGVRLFYELYGEGIVRELASDVSVGAPRPVGTPVSASVEGQHPVVAREVGDLGLPVPRVDDRPGGQEKHGALALAVQLVEEPHAVALDVAVLVRVARAGLLDRLRSSGGHFRRAGHRFASSRDPSQRSTISCRSR